MIKQINKNMYETEILEKMNELDKRLEKLIELFNDVFLTHEEYLLIKEADEIVKQKKIEKETIPLDEV